MRKKQLLLLVTLAALIGYGIWEYYVWQWAKDVAGPIIRVDAVILWPLLIGLVIMTVVVWVRDRSGGS